MNAQAMTTNNARTAKAPALIVLTLAMVMGMQPMATNRTLPDLPGLTLELGASMAQAQLMLTALLPAFGVYQLFRRRLSDRFGRRPMLLVGTSASVLAAWAQV